MSPPRGQLATCKRFHTLEQQLCLRLVQLIDHMGSNALDITQAELAQLIGARRERVNQIVGTLRASGMVDLGRGRLTPDAIGPPGAAAPGLRLLFRCC